MNAFAALLRRDLALGLRDGGALGTALGFYVIVVALMPLGLGPDPALLSRIAPGVLWIALLLAALLAAGRMFEADYDDGSLEVMAMASLPLELVALVKIIAHWLTAALPLVICAPALGLLLNLDLSAYGILVATLILGTPAISAIAAIGAALTLRARKGGLLIALIVLPLYIPTLVFGIATVTASLTGPAGSTLSPILVLASISMAALVLAPWAAAAAIRAQTS
jgi:heme exporter protein B